MVKIVSKIAVFAAVFVTALSCVKPGTSYRVDYMFDNTLMKSDFLSVYDPYKWRTNRHRLDTIYINGQMREFASGYLEEYLKDDVKEIVIDVEGYRPEGGIYKLDTVFTITPGTINYFRITTDMRWRNSVGELVEQLP